MTDPRPTKNQRREDARESARLAREKAKKRQQTLKWLVPVVASVAILAIVAGVIWAVIAFQPAPKSEAGPANMISDGIVFEGTDGAVTPVETDGIAKGDDPVPTAPRDDVLNIVTYVDFSCPVCKTFEETYSEGIQALVADGVATLEVHPIAILDSRFMGSRYSSRANNVGACVANYAPDSFLDVMAAMYANQPEESTTGLTNDQIVDIVTGAGLDDEDVTACINEESFAPWVASATQRALGGPLPNADISGVQGTPTVVVNGVWWDSSTGVDFPTFVQQQADAAGIDLTGAAG